MRDTEKRLRVGLGRQRGYNWAFRHEEEFRTRRKVCRKEGTLVRKIGEHAQKLQETQMCT